MADENAELLCMGCMSQKQNTGRCPVCGFDEQAYSTEPHHLPLRTILSAKYLVGRVIGEGGFGITYIGWDLNIDMKIAIKEFYPTGFATRENTVSNSISSYVGEKADFFENGKKKFVDEAKSLGKFFSLPGIVSVRDFFYENGTAYIVMEYVDGMTFKEYLDKMGGRIPAGQMFEMMKPLINSLREIHNEHIIHRDISPDNIMISNEGYVKLLDFGAARDFIGSGNKSLSVMLKPGYAPEEQYRSKGVQGPWTDVYALCATIYRAITGAKPDESTERLVSDNVVRPSMMGVNILPYQEEALMRGMAVRQQDRIQSMTELYNALYGPDSNTVIENQTQSMGGMIGNTNPFNVSVNMETANPDPVVYNGVMDYSAAGNEAINAITHKNRAKMIIPIVIACLIIAGLTVTTIYFASESDGWKRRYNNKSNSYSDLQNDYDSLKKECNEATRNLESSSNELQALQEQYDTVYADAQKYYSLCDDYDSLESSYGTLQTQVDLLEYQNESLQADYDRFSDVWGYGYSSDKLYADKGIVVLKKSKTASVKIYDSVSDVTVWWGNETGGVSPTWASDWDNHWTTLKIKANTVGCHIIDIYLDKDSAYSYEKFQILVIVTN